MSTRTPRWHLLWSIAVAAIYMLLAADMYHVPLYATFATGLAVVALNTWLLATHDK